MDFIMVEQRKNFLEGKKPCTTKGKVQMPVLHKHSIYDLPAACFEVRTAPQRQHEKSEALIVDPYGTHWHSNNANEPL